MSDDEMDAELQAEYDFSGGVRGKHYHDYRAGHTVTIHKKDGSIERQEFEPIEGTVFIDPDIRADFPDSESVNRALRAYRAAS